MLMRHIRLPSRFAREREVNEVMSAEQMSAELWHYSIWILGILVAMRIVAMVWDWILLPIARRTRTNLDTVTLTATRNPIQVLLLFTGISIALRHGVAHLPPEVAAALGWRVALGVAYAAVVLSVTGVAYAASMAFVGWYGESHAHVTARMDNRFVVLFRKSAKVIFLIVALTVILSHFGVQITGLLATAGVASLAIALAAQETLANLIAGFALMTDRIFVPGDRIQLSNGKIGDVIDVGLRSTKILTFDHTVITVPNSEIAKSEVTNYNAPNAKFTVRTTIGVAYGSDLHKVKKVLCDTASAHPEVMKEPPPSAYFTEFAESSLNLLLMYWVQDYRQYFRIRDEVNMAIKEAFETANIQIPFPQRDVHLYRQKD